MCSSKGTPSWRSAAAKANEFSTGTAVSSQVCQMKQGGVSLVTCSSFESSFTRSGAGSFPNRLFFEPGWV